MNKGETNEKVRKLWIPITWIVLVALLMSGCGSAQQNKVYHVGIMTSNPSFAAIGAGFKAKMTELGYIENKNIIYNSSTIK